MEPTSPTASWPASSTESTDGAEVEGTDTALPTYVEYRPSDLRRWLFGAGFVLAALFATVAVFAAVAQDTTSSMITAGSLIVLACALWWLLLSWSPRVITLSAGTLEIAQGQSSERFDLTNPKTEIELGDDPTARGWTAEVLRPNGSKVVIRSSQVRAQQFCDLVRHYRVTD